MAMSAKDFQDRFMANVQGQQPIMQSLFRQFLEWLEVQSHDPVDISGKQDKEDSTLATTAKTVVGAIGEVKTTADGAAQTAAAALPASAIEYDDNGHLVLTLGGVKYQIDATVVTEAEG